MIRVLSFLLLVSIVNAKTQSCDENTSYISFGAPLKDGQTPEEVCDCIYKYLEENKLLNGTKFECLERKELRDLKRTKLPYDGNDNNACTACLTGCQTTETNPEETCELINRFSNNESQTRKDPVLSRLRRYTRYFYYFYYESVTVFTPYGVYSYYYIEEGWGYFDY